MTEFIQSEDRTVTIIPLTIDYAEGVYQRIDENRAFLTVFDEQTANNYPNLDAFRDSILNPRNPNRARYVMLSHGVIAGSINLTLVNEDGSVLELGYWIAGNQFARQGITSTSAQLLSDEALRRPGVDEVVAFTHTMNHPSKKTLLRAGFLYFGVVGVGAKEKSKFFKS